MKKFVLGFATGIVTLLCFGAVSAIKHAIYLGLLQSDFDCGQFSLTNALATTASHVFLPTNSESAWPAQANFIGESVFVNSNSAVYILTSSPTSTAWAATNKLAP